RREEPQTKERAPAEAGAVTVPAGNRKVCIYRPDRRAESISRVGNGGKPVPSWLVYELTSDKVAQVLHAFSFRGPEVEPCVHWEGGRPFAHIIPARIPDTTGSMPEHQIGNVEWFFHTVGELTVYTEGRAA